MIDWLLSIEHELYVAFISVVPIIELRGAVPYAVSIGFPWYKTYLLTVLSNCLVVPVIVLLGREIMLLGKKFRLTSKLFLAIEKRTLAKQDVIRKYSAPGLILLVAIPLPGTGAWTGALIASLLNLRVKDAMLYCCVGVAIAGVVVTLLSYGVSAVIG